jgi:phosphoglycolate phosphatase
VSLAPALRHPRAILFDWDNTLVDSWATIHDALNFLMEKMGKPAWTLAETRARAQRSLRETFPLIFGERWEEAGAIYMNRFREIHLDRLTAMPGREAMLRALHGDGIYLGIVSNKTGEVLRREAERLGWTGLFGSIVGAGDASVDKPSAEPVHLALAPSGVLAGDEVWFVGDAPVDIECARNSGCVAVLFANDMAPEEVARLAPQLAVADDAGLFRALRGLRFGAARPSS